MSDSVTIVARRRVKPGREAEYEAWLSRMTEGARAGFPGYLGVGFHRPEELGGEYRTLFRFDSLEQLEAFEKSEFRMRMLAEGAELFVGDAAWDRLTGLEFWFDPPRGTKVPQPSPHRMALVLIGVVSSSALLLSLVLGPLMTGWPQPLRILVTATIQVGLMTYVVMPRLTPRIARFIYPKATTL